MAEQNDAGKPRAGEPSMRVRIDERDMATGYANAFRTHVTGEEVLVDFGLNLPAQPQAQGGHAAASEMLFRVTQRVVLSPQTAKRLAITLAQVVREHESRFGELKLDVGQRG